MRLVSAVCIAIGLAVVSFVRADEASDARAIVEKAIEAHGGADNISKLNGRIFRERGVYHGTGKPLPYRGAYAIHFPDRLRMDIEGVFMVILNGDKGWIRSNGETKDMNAQEFAQQQTILYEGYIATLVPLLDKKAFKLSPLAGRTVADRPLIGVKVGHSDRPDMGLYFDKKSGLLNVLAQLDGKRETYFSGYLSTEGVEVATKILMKRDGNLFVEADVYGTRSNAKWRDSDFGRP